MTDQVLAAFKDALPPVCAGNLPPDDELRAILARVVAHALRGVSDQITHRVGELRDNHCTGTVGIEYINGMEDADTFVEQAIAGYEMTAFATRRPR